MLWTHTNKFVFALCVLMGVVSARLQDNTKTLDHSDASTHLDNETQAVDRSEDSRELYSYCPPGQLCYDNCENYLLSLSDEELFELAHSSDNSKRIGQYCYVYDNTGKPGACDYYAKGFPSSIGDSAVPGNDGGGTGCVLGGKNRYCYMNTINHLTAAEKASMCTYDYKKNGGAAMRWAIQNRRCTDSRFIYFPLCWFVSAKILYLSQTDENLFELAHSIHNNKRIGKYCYVYDNTGKAGACSYYAKGRPIPTGADSAVPGNDGGGTGCVLGGRNSFCYMNTISRLSPTQKASMCTYDYRKNSGAAMRYAIWNDLCMDEGATLWLN